MWQIDAGEQHRKEKRLSKKAEEVSNTLQEEHFKVERLLKAQQQLENLKEPQNATETGKSYTMMQLLAGFITYLKGQGMES